jgi:hypothetical protein
MADGYTEEEYAGAETIVTLPEGAEQFLHLKVAIRYAFSKTSLIDTTTAHLHPPLLCLCC